MIFLTHTTVSQSSIVYEMTAPALGARLVWQVPTDVASAIERQHDVMHDCGVAEGPIRNWTYRFLCRHCGSPVRIAA